MASRSSVAVDPCLFPRFEDGLAKSDRTQFIKVELNQLLPSESVGSTHTESFRSLLCASWALVLHCYTGSEKICFGFQDLDRHDSDTAAAETQIACFDATPSKSLRDLSSDMFHRRNWLPAADALTNSELLEGSLESLFNTAIICRTEAARHKGSVKTISSATSRTRSAKGHDILLHVKLLNGSPSVFLEWSSSFMSIEQARNIADTFGAVAASLQNNPDISITELDYVSARDKRILATRNAAPLTEESKCIHNLIHQQAIQRPKEEAVCSWDGSFTFEDLDATSSRLAKYLIDMGVERNTFVPLCFEKSAYYIVSMVAVMKAGAAFVPLDPSHPVERLEKLVKSVNARIALCSRSRHSDLQSIAKSVLPVDLDLLNDLQQEQNNDVTAPRDVAYLIFTSGSTGEPKGVIIEHAAFCSSAKYHGPAQKMGPRIRTLQFAAHTFDASLVEILTSLTLGGCVCIPSEEERLNDLAAVMNRMEVEYAILTPSVASFMKPSDVPRLQSITLVGEAMSTSHIATWSQINLINGYGPSECAVASVVNSSVTIDTAPANIGYPIGVHCWVVDRENHDKLVPVGSAGELVIEGPTVSRGYLNDPEKTSQSFITAPQWAKDLSLPRKMWSMYKTGDLVRQNSDGSLTFAGRKDTQVKYHGQRIELGEIEHHLMNQEMVKHGLVLLPKQGPCKGKLVSILTLVDMVVPRTDGTKGLQLIGADSRPTALRNTSLISENMTSSLPAYMIPTLWIVVENFPFLASGKLDRRGIATWLSSMDVSTYLEVANASELNDDEPRDLNETENSIKAAWSHVLNIPFDQISSQRPFIGLGGDSISAMQVISQCKRQGISVTVQNVLKSKSVVELASCATTVKSVSYAEESVEENFDLTPIQELYFSLQSKSQGHFNQSFFLRVSGLIEESQLQQAIHAVVSHHPMLRSRFRNTPGGWKQRITKDINGSFQVHSHQLDAQEKSTPIIARTQESLDAIHGPLFAADLFNFADGDQTLFLVGHHLVIDLVSWRVILEEVEDLLKNDASSLEEKSMPFQVWSSLQAEHAAKFDVEKVLPNSETPSSNYEFWGMGDKPNIYGDVEAKGFEMDAQITSAILTSCHRAFNTEPVELLLSALLFSFSRAFSDREPPAIFTEGHGREPWEASIDLSRTIGWFTTMYPVHVPISQFDAVSDTVRLVKDYRRRIPDNGRPYFASSVLHSVGKDRFSSHWPLEVTFNYLGQYQQLERNDALLRPAEVLAGEFTGSGGISDFGATAPRFGLFEISAVIVKGRLRFSFTYNNHMAHQSNIRDWVSLCELTLQEMASTLVDLTPEPTLSDFSSQTLTYERLRSLTNTKLPSLGISAGNLQDVYQCSNIQQGLLLSQTKDSGFYAVQVAYEVRNCNEGKVDASRLAESWIQVVRRHAALRTIFVDNIGDEAELYSQVVLKDLEPSIVYEYPQDEPSALTVMKEKRALPSDAGRPQHRFTICLTPTGKVYCKLEISHTIMDGHSMSIIFRDLKKFYLDALPLGQGPLYSDYISYVNELDFASGLSFWKQYLKDVEPCHFPALYDGDTTSKELRSVRVEIDKLSEISAFCASKAITFSNILNVAWALTLHSYIGMPEEVCFGYLVSGRDAPIKGVEDAVGPMINMVACRLRFNSDCTLDDLLSTVQKDYSDSVDYWHTSLAEIQHTLQLSGAALFNTVLSYRRLPPSQDLADKTLVFDECLPIYDPTEYGVSLNVEVSDESAVIDLDYWTDFIADGQARNIANVFLQSLQNIIHSSDKKITDLQCVSEACMEQVMQWNCEIPAAIEDCVHHAFKKQAVRRAAVTAVDGWDASFTYEELDRLSGQLASYLMAIGVGPDVFVPLCFDKSAWTIVAMFGVLKAGGAIVPLDASHPKNALEMRVRNCEAFVVLAAPSRTEIFEDMVPEVISVEPSLFQEIAELGESVCSSVTPEDTAVIIYTSGSTGMPKGVMLGHSNLVTSAEAHGSVLGITENSRVLQFATYTFDNSLEEIVTTLLRGGCVCVPSEHDKMNDLAGAINRMKVNWSCLTPTVATFLRPLDVPTLKTLELGGEVLTRGVIDIWKDYVHLHGCYGPSECSINCAWTGQVGKGGNATNIGRAIGSVSWIVDPNNHNRLLPVGAVGELLVEGPIVGRGYLKDDEKTAAAFINSPTWSTATREKQQRFYKTGDLVRYDSNGSLVYIGRKDSQVKINGQRLELGEIEHNVKQHLGEVPSAVEAIVVNAGGRNLKALVAFMQVSSDAAEDAGILAMSANASSIAGALEIHLAGCLPSYMVPTIYIPVSQMPMTSSGKLDRRQLRIWAQAAPDSQMATYRLAKKTGRAPSTYAEKTLQKVWAEILGISEEQIGADDSFFRLGGDSIGAMRTVTAARSHGMILTVTSIFQVPKLADLANAATSNTEVVADTSGPTPFSLIPKVSSVSQLIAEISSEIKLPVNSIQDVYPCTPIQEGLIALSAKQTGAYVSHSVFDLPQSIDVPKFRRAWDSIVDEETILRTRIVYTEKYGFLQVVVNKPVGWQSAFDLNEICGSTVALPDSNGGALAKFAIIGEHGAGKTFVWTAHHAIYDGWSMPLILSKVEERYQGITSAGVGRIPNFSSFIEYVSKIDTQVSDAFWLERLSDLSAVPFPQLPNTSYEVRATSNMTFNAQFSAKPSPEITMASRVRAAWALVNAIHSNSDDVIFGETMTGRDAPVSGIEDMTGPTLATIPCRIKLDRSVNVSDFLKYVQDLSATAIPFQNKGLQGIKHLSAETAAACEFQNLIAISHAVSTKADTIWLPQGHGTVGSNFFTYPLTVTFKIDGLKVEAEAHYDHDVIPAWLLQNTLRQFEFILQKFCDSTFETTSIGSLELLNTHDVELIKSWNTVDFPYVDRTAHGKFEEQVLLRPAENAVESWDATFTYGELDKMTSALAAKLIKDFELTPGSYVPFCFEKSAWAIVAMYAIMRAGAAFVPLDPTFPTARLQSICGDVEAKIILCSANTEEKCKSLVRDVIPITPGVVNSIDPRGASSLPLVSSKAPAYVIFTSGSTGKPKGTVVSHGAYCSSAAAHCPALEIKEGCRSLQFASYTFDASLLEILGVLAVGGCVCVPDENTRLNNVTSFINQYRVTWTFLTPSFVATFEPSDVPGLITLCLGGEALNKSNISTWANKVHLINGYGPTETTIIATGSKLTTVQSNPANLGKSLSARSWITDPHNHDRLTPVGSPGELLFEGPILADGYIKNEAKTEEVFITNPAWAVNGSLSNKDKTRRFYKTGDMVKYSVDGTLIFLGRKDTQTKLNGQRLELGEIEHHLRTNGLVKHAIAFVPKSGPCQKRLVAVLSLQDQALSGSTSSDLCVVDREAAAFNLSSIREALCQNVPSYMVPSRWIVLSNLPLLPSGKLDLRRTKEWVDNISGDVYRQITDTNVASGEKQATGVAKQIQQIFSKVLNLDTENVGLSHSFFHLGGDSISAMQAMSRCRKEGLGITVQDIMRSKSIHEIAEKVKVPQQNNYQEEQSSETFDLTPVQKVYFECMGNRLTHFDQSVVLQLKSFKSVEQIRSALEAVVKAHSMLRARYMKVENGWQQRVEPDCSASWAFNSNEVSSKSEMYSSIEKDHKKLSITKGPVFAASIFEIAGEQTQVISLIAHHLVIDVVSWRVIMDDLEELLMEKVANVQQSLPFSIWARLQRAHAEEKVENQVLPAADVPAANLAFWAMADQPNNQGDTIEANISLDVSQTMQLLGGCHDALNTDVVDIFLAALLHSFRCTFSDRATAPAIYNEGHGREPWDDKHDISRTVGWFTTLSPIHLPRDSEGDGNIVNMVRWVKDIRRRMPGKGRSYFEQRMHTAQGEQRFGSHWPMEVVFNYLGQFQQLEKKDALFQQLDSGADVGKDVPRFALIEISAMITQGTLKMSFDYNRLMKHQEGIKRWVSECQSSLCLAIAKLSEMKLERTLSEFPLVPVTYNGMSDLIKVMPEYGVPSISEIEDIYPCAPTQRGIILSQIKDPKAYAYQLLAEIIPTGASHEVDMLRVADAWQSVVQRHPALRTVIIDNMGGAGLMNQVVLKQISAHIIWLNGDDARQLLDEQPAFNCLDKQPPHRLTLCRTPENKMFFKLEMSHSISDGTSVPIMLGDLKQAYAEKDVKWIDQPLYSDFIAHIQDTSSEKGINYWKSYLNGTEACHFPRLTEEKNIAHDLRGYDLELSESSQLQKFCMEHGLTLSNVLQLTWALVLRYYSGSDEVCFGYLASGRDVPVPNIHSAVGAFINMLVCRLNLKNEMQLSQVLEQVQNDYIQSMSHQTCSLAEIQHELQMSGNSLYDTAFSFQKRSAVSDDPSSLIDFSVIKAEDPSEYGITLNAEVYGDKVVLGFSYYADVISNRQMSILATTFEHILHTVARPENFTKQIGELNLLAPQSRQQIMTWNKEIPAKVDNCVHQIIEHQAWTRPADTQAVCAWDANFTYRELILTANSFAAKLRALGVGPETFVPICFEKSAWAIVAMVGIMKAGGAFVPLDPSHPTSRHRSLVENVGAKIIVCSKKYQQAAADAAPVALVLDKSIIKEGFDHDLESSSAIEATPSNAAYIIFTSGTTGMPKGTVIEHAAFCTGSTEHSRAILMNSDSRVIQFASYTFDASVMEILSCLLVGGCVCVPSDQERIDSLPKAFSDYRVNWTLLTPSVVKILKPADVPGLRVLVTGGEAMSPDHLQKWGGHMALVNAYGPSECSVIATTSTKVDEHGRILNEDPATIGHAVGGRSWVVDPRNHDRLMPVGCVGELVVEGHHVAREYLNNVEKTTAAFISNPSWILDNGLTGIVATESKMYKTGDLVRYNLDGSVTFLSRKDTQIKLNGQRIEVGEIEHHIKTGLPENAQYAVDLVAPSGRSGKALVAFLCLDPATARSEKYQNNLSSTAGLDADEILMPMTSSAVLSARALESHLGNVLPSYMIPSLYVPVAEMPWTSSGKLDRARLKNAVQSLPKEAIAPYRLATNTTKKAPATDKETKLSKLWENVLSLSSGSVGIEDNFFRLGGDSLAAMKLVQAASAEKVFLTVINIFRHPTLKEMAENCEIDEVEDFEELTPFCLLKSKKSFDELLEELADSCGCSTEDIVDAYPCSSLQEGLITMTVKQPGAYVARNLFKLPASLDMARFKSAWQSAIEEIDVLRTRIVHASSSEFIQVVLGREEIQWYNASSLQEAQEQYEMLPAKNGGALAQYSIVEEEDSSNRYFILSIHHSVYDGWSMPKVLQRVEDIYVEGGSTLPMTAYARFIQYLRASSVQDSEDYWIKRLSDVSPTHFPQATSAINAEENYTRTLQYSTNLSAAMGESEVTFPTLLRATWALILSTYSASNDVVFGETMTGRDIPLPGVTDILGPTLTTVPTRININSALSVKSFLRSVQDNATDSIAHQHLGLQHIRRLNGETGLACEFQNLLVIQVGGVGKDDSIWDPVESGIGDSFFTYPLVLECNMGGQHIDFDAHHDERVVSRWQVQRILFQFESVLNQLIAFMKDSEKTVAEISIFSKQDLDTVRGWNTHTPEVIHENIHMLFRQKSLAQPDTQAVCAWDNEVTYKQLLDLATKLAKELIDLGVTAEVKVPICMDKSSWAIVGILGVLIAGGAFVPLDPLHPRSRHEEIINDVGANTILCSPKYRERFTSVAKSVLAVSSETINKLPEVKNTADFFKRSNPKNAAYVIYTSGSTGKPKGTVVEHRAFCTSSAGFQDGMLLQSDSRVLQFASFTFDVSVMEVLSTLICGGCVCVPSDDERLTDLAGAIQRMSVTWAFLTPSFANILEPSDVPSLKTLVCGGEAMSVENVSKWADNVQLVNGYGPTEASVIALANPDISTSKDPSNIGRHLQGGHAWIGDLANNDRLAPVGCPGELLLEGPHLAREYLNNAEKTREAFLTNPAWTSFVFGNDKSTKRVYKTGDLVRYSEDGSVSFIGRKDNQVKLRGQRLELGEIENRMDVIPFIKHALVSLPKKGVCKQNLVAVISMTDLDQYVDKGAPNTCNLISEGSWSEKARAHLAETQKTLSDQLPPYMVPSIWAIVESVPLLASGKLDRRLVGRWIDAMDDETYNKITDSGDDNTANEDASASAKNLQQMICKVLNLPLERVKLTQSFIALGGDSISAMQVMARARKQKLKLALNDILRSKSIIQMASYIESDKATAVKSEVVDTPFELSPIQQLFFGQSADKSNGDRFNQSFTLRINRRVEPEKIHKAFESMVRQHSMLRARFLKNDKGVWQQKITDEVDSSYTFSVHNVASKKAVVPIVAAAQSSTNVVKGPIMASRLFNIEGDKQALFIAIHHLSVDIVSWRIILEELEEFVETGKAQTDKPLSYQSWLSMQSTHANDEIIKMKAQKLPCKVSPANVGYWGMKGRPNVYGDVETDTIEFSEDTTKKVFGDCHKAFRTEPIDLLISTVSHAFATTFSDRQCATIFNESHGRDIWTSDIDLSRTIGWFTTMMPIQIQSETKNGVLDSIRRTKDCRFSTPEKGRQYLAHRFLTPEGRFQFRDHTPIEILFNYMGNNQGAENGDALFEGTNFAETEEEQIMVSDVSKDATRLALFEVSASMSKGRLQFTFMYNKQMKRKAEIQRWIKNCELTLNNAVKQLSNAAPEPTLSDYPLLPISYEGLRKVVEEKLPEFGITDLERVEDIYPVAPLQEGLMLSQFRDKTAYMLHIFMKIKPPRGEEKINAQRMVSAWQQVVDRHPVLRSIFYESVCKGVTFDQVVVKKADSGAHLISCKDEDEAFSEFEKYDLVTTNQQRKLQLPHQVTVAEVANGDVYLKAEINHAVIDGDSLTLMMHQIGAAYEGKLAQEPAALYSDYISYVRGQPIASSIRFWKNLLSNVQPTYFPTLPVEKSAAERPLRDTYIDFSRFEELRKICEEMQITVANVFQATWALVLRKFIGTDDVCFGYLTNGRDVPIKGIQEAIGAFINMLVCRVRFSSSSTLLDSYRKVQHDYIESLPHQHISLAQIQNELGLDGKHLFNTVMSIRKRHRISKDEPEEGTTMGFEQMRGYDPNEYAVSVNINATKGEEAVLLRYWADMVTEEQVSEIKDTFADYLEKFIRNPQVAAGVLSDMDRPIDIIAPIIKNAETTEASPQEGQILSTGALASPDLEAVLRRIVRESVTEVIGEMFGGSGLLSIKEGSQAIAGMVQQETARALEGAKALAESDFATMEKRLRTLWSTQLNEEEGNIKNDSNFFSLGGDSIIAMQLNGMAREDGIVMSVADLFQTTTFGEFVKKVEQANQTQALTTTSAQTTTEPIAPPEPLRPYKRYALLKTEQVSSFLRDFVCPKVRVFRGGIIDVLPVTDFQSLAITGSLLRSKWMMNHFYFDGEGPVDVVRLKQTAYQLVQSFDILRTVFVTHEDQYLQVVLRNLQPDFVVYDVDEDLDTFSQTLHRGLQENGPRVGEPYVKFVVARQKNTERHRIFMRLSHAQYDGVCLPRILTALQAAYEGEQIPTAPPFSEYVWNSQGKINQTHYDHWTNLLEGSTMTDIVNRNGPSYVRSADADTTIERKISIPSYASDNITPATLVKAAWSYVLAQLAGSPDVVFGHVISGRNGAVPSVEKIVGACLNIVPVRVKLDAGMKVIDLLRIVQEQQVGNMPFESLGFREIIKKCTDWPDWTYFSTLVQHQNIDQDAELRVGGVNYKVGCVATQQDFADMCVVTSPLGADQLSVSVSFSPESSIDLQFANKVLDMLAVTLEHFAADTQADLLSPAEVAALPPQTLHEIVTVAHDAAAVPNNFRGFNRKELIVLSDSLSRAWRQVLGRPAKPDPAAPGGDDLNINSSFFDAGGDIIALAQAATLVEADGFRANVEDLAARPTMVEQMACLAQLNAKRLRTKTASAEASSDDIKSPVVEEKKSASKHRSLFGSGGRDAKEKEAREGVSAADKLEKFLLSSGEETLGGGDSTDDEGHNRDRVHAMLAAQRKKQDDEQRKKAMSKFLLPKGFGLMRRMTSKNL